MTIELTWVPEKEAWFIGLFKDGKVMLDSTGYPPILYIDSKDDLWKQMEQFKEMNVS